MYRIIPSSSTGLDASPEDCSALDSHPESSKALVKRRPLGRLSQTRDANSDQVCAGKASRIEPIVASCEQNVNNIVTTPYTKCKATPIPSAPSGYSPANYNVRKERHARAVRSVVDALYHRAEYLAFMWRNANLSVDFQDRMIDATWAYLGREGTRVSSNGAARALTWIWRRNARRDATRAARKPKPVSLDEVVLGVADRTEAETSAILDHCRQILTEAGERDVVVEAFIQDAIHDTAEEAVVAVAGACGGSVSIETLRQWRRRHFRRFAEILRSESKALGFDVA